MFGNSLIGTLAFYRHCSSFRIMWHGDTSHLSRGLLLQTQCNGYDKLSTATGLSVDSDKQCLKGYFVTSLMLHFSGC